MPAKLGDATAPAVPVVAFGTAMPGAVVVAVVALFALAAASRAWSRAWNAETDIHSPIKRITGIVMPAKTAKSFNPRLRSPSPSPTVYVLIALPPWKLVCTKKVRRTRCGDIADGPQTRAAISTDPFVKT